MNWQDRCIDCPELDDDGYCTQDHCTNLEVLESERENDATE